MNKQEAIEAMKQGMKVQHWNFTSLQWVKSNKDGTRYTLDNGVEYSEEDFWTFRTGIAWEHDWKIYARQ